jgi:hypothetical protein
MLTCLPHPFKGVDMINKLIVLLLAMSMCGFWGCASSRSIDTAAARTNPVAKADAAKTDEIIPTSPKSIDTVGETKPAVHQKREQLPSRSSAIADEPEQTPTSTPKVRPNDVVVLSKNDVVVQPATAAKNGTPERKPAEMKVANGFDHNPYLSSILKPLLPPRTTLMDAATGFKNERQFIAAMHLSRNLDIPFAQIKTRMTGEHHMSLNDSLRDIRPEMTKHVLKAEVNKAEDQAKADENHAKDEAKKAAAQSKVATN